jgi:hypothetical protein
MTLRQKQSKFARMTALLILHAEQLGFEVTFGEAWRHPSREGGHPKSLHKQRLAVDLNLFKAGKWLKSTEAHRPLGEYWESIGGTWGGRFKDGNHYSLSHGGMK